MTERKPIKTGRNLPAAIGVSVILGGLVLVTLFTIKFTFLIYVGIIVSVAFWELSHALRSRDIHLPLIPIAAGGIAMVTLAYLTQVRWVLAALALAGIAVLAWRLPGGAAGYVRDVTAGLFTLLYLPLMAVFVALMLAEPDGSRRALIFVVLTVCSDTGGYAAGILVGKHPMVPSHQPEEDLGGPGRLAGLLPRGWRDHGAGPARTAASGRACCSAWPPSARRPSATWPSP